MIWKSGSHPPSLLEDLDLEVTDLEVTDFGTGFPPKADNFGILTTKLLWKLVFLRYTTHFKAVKSIIIFCPGNVFLSNLS